MEEKGSVNGRPNRAKAFEKQPWEKENLREMVALAWLNAFLCLSQGDSKVEMCVKKLIGQERMLWIVLVFLNMGEVLLC